MDLFSAFTSNHEYKIVLVIVSVFSAKNYRILGVGF